MADNPTHYQTLGLIGRQHDLRITADDLRQAYKQALLHHHPDKQNGHKNGGQTSSIDDISEAYRVLSDPEARAVYDRQLRARGQDESMTRHTGMETIDLEELDFSDNDGIWQRTCRCGSNPAYVITEAELEKNAGYGELITGCKGCSLWLKVLFTVEE